MRSCLYSGLFAGLLIAISTVSTAQPDRHSGGITVSRDTKLTAGDEITVAIKEDHDPVLTTIVTDTGEVELNGLGRVYIAGRTTAEAAALVATYLKQKYYHKATVKIGIRTKAAGAGARPFKVVVSGKVGRPGPQYFTDANPLKLTEAVIVAGTTLYSEVRKVRLTRRGQNVDHNVEQIMKEGRTAT
jgi:protein involved in polysaccharide export with SLBB domain